MKNFLWYKEINYWRIEFVIFISVDISWEHSWGWDTLWRKPSCSALPFSMLLTAPWCRWCSQVLWRGVTCCKWVFSQGELLVLLKGLGIRTWLLWVQSIFSPQKNECGRVWMVQQQTATKPKLSVLIHPLFQEFPASGAWVPPWEAVMAAHDPSVHTAVCAAPKAQTRPTTFPLPGTAGKPWHRSCSVAHEERVANCCLKNYMKAAFSSHPKLNITKPPCQGISAL